MLYIKIINLNIDNAKWNVDDSDDSAILNNLDYNGIMCVYIYDRVQQVKKLVNLDNSQKDSKKYSFLKSWSFN